MKYPKFFDEIEHIVLKDELSEFLGSAENGIIDFPFAIRNQFTVTLSTLEAVKSIKNDLLNYQRDFYVTAKNEAAKDPVNQISV